MLARMIRISKMSYLNIQNRSQCSFGCALEVHLTQKKSAKIGLVCHELILSTQTMGSSFNTSNLNRSSASHI